VYRLTANPDFIIRLDDGTYIPRGHRWWDDYEAWVNEGNLPEPAEPVPTLASLQAELRTRATSLRWTYETGGIEVDGVRVGTALDDQNRISTVLTAGELGDIEEVDFKAASGWVRLSLAQIQAIAGAITAHVQACFSAERAHHEAIDALGDLEAAAGYDVTVGWPA